MVSPAPRTAQMWIQMSAGPCLGPAPALGLPPGGIEREQWGRVGRKGWPPGEPRVLRKAPEEPAERQPLCSGLTVRLHWVES